MVFDPNKLDMFKITGLGKKPQAPDKKYAGFNRRMMAATVDMLIIAMLIAPLIDMALEAMFGPVSIDFQAIQAQQDSEQAKIMMIKAIHESGYFERWLINTLVQMLVLLAVNGLCWLRWSSTPGKMLFGLVIADASTEQPISREQIVKRLAGYIFAGLPLMLGFLAISFSKRRQGWHDKYANTVVMQLPLKEHPLYQAMQLLFRKVTGNHQQGKQ